MNTPNDILEYESVQSKWDQEICIALRKEIELHLPEATSKVWHGHPVWFLDNNPIVGYAKLKDSIELLFWSGQSFEMPWLKKSGNFKAAEKRYTNMKEVIREDLIWWLKESRDIQWDYANIVKRKGELIRLK